MSAILAAWVGVGALAGSVLWPTVPDETFVQVLVLGCFVTCLPTAFVVLQVARFREWWMRWWPSLPTDALVTAVWPELPDGSPVRSMRSPLFSARRSNSPNGTLLVAACRMCFLPDEGSSPPPPFEVAPVVHTRRIVPVLGGTTDATIILVGNRLYGQQAVVPVRLPSSWHTSDVITLLTAAGFEALRTSETRWGAQAVTDLGSLSVPTDVRGALNACDDVWG